MRKIDIVYLDIKRLIIKRDLQRYFKRLFTCNVTHFSQIVKKIFNFVSYKALFFIFNRIYLKHTVLKTEILICIVVEIIFDMDANGWIRELISFCFRSFRFVFYVNLWRCVMSFIIMYFLLN